MKRLMMKTTGLAAAAVACMALTAAPAQAGSKWNEKTILKFDSPVMIPGTVLAPGTYVFRLADSKADRNVMEVFGKDGQNLLATALTVPTKRLDANGDVVLKFAQTQGQEPVALKAFFYPGSLYGHEFIYSDNEAKKIAENTHTVVLSHDVAGSDMESGTLHTMNASGQRGEYQPDANVARDWAAWVVEWRPVAAIATTGTANGAPTGTSGRSAESTESNAGSMGSKATTGTSGAASTGSTTTTNTMSSSKTPDDVSSSTASMNAQEHAQAIQELVQSALRNNGASTVTIDRDTLTRIKSHADAIASGSGSPRR